jgi:hypothetical protein
VYHFSDCFKVVVARVGRPCPHCHRRGSLQFSYREHPLSEEEIQRTFLTVLEKRHSSTEQDLVKKTHPFFVVLENNKTNIIKGR